MNVVLYGPPASGKSSVGRLLAERLARPFVDTDDLVTARAGRPIHEIFETRGEAHFRALEAEICRAVAAENEQVVALGGGSLLDAATRLAFERSGLVVCLTADRDDLHARATSGAAPERPLVARADPHAALDRLLRNRAAHYASFPERVDTSGRAPSEVAALVADGLRERRVTIDAPPLHQTIAIAHGILGRLDASLAELGLPRPALLVCDQHVADHLGSLLPPGIARAVLPPGEPAKSLASAERLCERFAASGVDRHGSVLAVGGGVIGDLAGFCAAIFMRGIRWVNVPTTVLAMVDAGIGGKAGVNLASGKNLVGAFHAADLVLVDPRALATLPAEERTSGMAEVVKHAVIGGEEMFGALERAPAFGSAAQLAESLAVKARIVQEDPTERGLRAILNLGHTIGHGIEAASDYAIRHGEAVAVGMVAEARLAEAIGLASPGLADRIAAVLALHGLPTACLMDPEAVRRFMATDKKKRGGAVTFALPAAIGHVAHGVRAEEGAIAEAVRSVTSPR